MPKLLYGLLLLLLLCSCKGENEVKNYHYIDADFSVQCLHGVKYLTRKYGSVSYIVVKINKDTLLPERCENRG